MNTKASNIIHLNYQGLNVGFTGEGWFNATLTTEQLALLTALEERNAVLLAQRVNRDDHKQKPAQFAQDWRNGQGRLGRAA